MRKKLFTREDKTIDHGRVEKRGYNPMPADWKPPARVPYHQASRPPQPRRSAEERPLSPPSADRDE